MHGYIYAAIAAVLLTTTAACSRREAAVGIVYAVSIEPQRWILEQLADSSATIVTMLPAGSNPETFDPSVNLRAKAEKAAAYFGTGALPFEDSFRRADGIPFFDTSADIDRIYGTHDHIHTHHGHDHETEADPHFWTSVAGARQIAANMTSALKDLDPANAAAYDSRFNILAQKLDSMSAAIASRLAAVPSRTFAVWHPSLSYFARDYGLHQLTVGQEGKEMSARQMKEVIDEAIADSVRVFFFQRQYDAGRARTINDAIGSRMVTIDPLAYEWDEQLNLIADELVKP